MGHFFGPFCLQVSERDLDWFMWRLGAFHRDVRWQTCLPSHATTNYNKLMPALMNQPLNIRWPEAFWSVASRLYNSVHFFPIFLKKRYDNQKPPISLPAACYLDWFFSGGGLYGCCVFLVGIWCRGGGGNLGCQKVQRKKAGKRAKKTVKKRSTHRAMQHMLIPNKASHIRYH